MVSVAGSEQGGRFFFYLVCLGLVFDLVRPAFVWHFPKMIFAILIPAWILKSEKVWTHQMTWFVALLVVMVGDFMIADNLHDAVWLSYGMLTLFAGTCIPLINFTTSFSRLRILVNLILVMFFYVAVYAITHEGYGPAGAAGGQDENYVAAAMNLVIPLAGFSFFLEKSFWRKLWFGSLVCLYVMAIIVGLSRGGFLGLIVAMGYCVLKTPKKGLAVIMVMAVGGLLVLAAGASYWEEMRTITDTTESTVDLRLEYWKIAIREFMEYPLTGVGPGNYPWRMNEFQTPEQWEKFGRFIFAEVHSTYFQLLAELGLAGCFVFGMFLFRIYRDYLSIGNWTVLQNGDASIRPDNRSDGRFIWIEAYRKGLMGGILGYLVSVAFLSSLYYAHLWVFASMMSALAVIANKALARVDADRAKG